MKLLNKLIFFFYNEILFEIINSKVKCKNIFNEFYKSLNSLSYFYILVIFFYQILVNLAVLLLKLIFILHDKKNANLIAFKVLKKLPFFKNINNFIFANLLLHYHE
jgi:hypothetical protein